MLDLPRSAIVSLSLVLKFGLDPVYSFGYIAFFIFCRFDLKLPIHALFGGGGQVWGIFPQMTSPIVLTPKRHFLTRKHANFGGSGAYLPQIWSPVSSIVLTHKRTILARKHVL